MQQHSKSEAIGLASLPASAKIDKMKNAVILPYTADSEIDSHAGESEKSARVKESEGSSRYTERKAHCTRPRIHPISRTKT